MDRSREHLIARYTYGLSLEKQGYPPMDVAHELGYSQTNNYQRMKRHVEEMLSNQKIQTKISSDEPRNGRLSRTQEAKIARYQKGMQMEAQGISDDEIAVRLGYSKTKNWLATKALMQCGVPPLDVHKNGTIELSPPAVPFSVEFSSKLHFSDRLAQLLHILLHMSEEDLDAWLALGEESIVTAK